VPKAVLKAEFRREGAMAEETTAKATVLFCTAEAKMKGVLSKDVQAETSLIGSTCPDYTQLLPTKWTARTVVHRAKLLAVVQRASLSARRAASVAVLNAGDGRATVTTTPDEWGENAGDVGATLEGDEDEVAVNRHHLVDVFSRLGGQQVALERVAKPGQPLILRGIDLEDGCGSLAPVMPMGKTA
jgi:DNA polymerase III sliding clamp (beta) subunit (PCNA family)